MNKTSIEWTRTYLPDGTYRKGYTWSPITGCTRRCAYCYAHRLAKGRLRNLYLANPNVAPGCDPDDPFAPRFWRNRLDEPCQKVKPTKIFVCSMGELFDPRVPNDWIKAVLAVAWICERHTFQFLTKQAYKATQFTFPSNAWVGLTVDYDGTETWANQTNMKLVEAAIRFVSYEPLLSPIKYIPSWANWIIIGAMTGPGAIKPKREWVQRLIDVADKEGIPVFLKDNLNWPEPRREWPREK